ncbi:transmembrane protein [Spatholobus suberectus]|nr:transmembrane protein [Spatholobus suberectus]
MAAYTYAYMDILIPSNRKLQQIELNVCWNPPSHGWLKCNIDGLFYQSGLVTSCVSVFRDHCSANRLGFLSNLRTASVFEAELWDWMAIFARSTPLALGVQLVFELPQPCVLLLLRYVMGLLPSP